MSMKCVVRVVEARGLKAADLNGKSDPYVRVSLKGSSKVQRTRTLYKTLSPIWNEEFIIQPVTPNDVLEFTIWDQDAVRDDFLGELHIPLSNYTNQMKDEWKPVLERTHGIKSSALKKFTGIAPMKAHGELHFQIFVGTGNPQQMQQSGAQMQQPNYASQQSYGAAPQQAAPQYKPQQQYGAAQSQQPPQYGMTSAPQIAPSYPQAQPSSSYQSQSSQSQPPQYGMTSAPQSTPSYPPSQPPAYQQSAQPTSYGQSPYAAQSSYGSQYPQNTPGAQMHVPAATNVNYPTPLPPAQYPGNTQLRSSSWSQFPTYSANPLPSSQLRNSNSWGQYPDPWGPKPDFSSLGQPMTFSPM